MRLARRDVHTGFWWESTRERDHLEDVEVNRGILLKWLF
jgi:hypothetical protein